jgi:uncharacterized protein (DUF58 family)
MALVAVICYAADAAGGWPVFQMLWVACLLAAVAAGVVALLPVRPDVEIEVSPRRTVAGDTARVSIRAVRARRRFPLPGPLVQIPVGSQNFLVRLPTLRRSRAVQEQITLDGLRRGVLRVGPVSAWRTDPLGLVRWTERWSAVSELLVLPRMVAVGAMTGGAVRDQEGTPSDEISMSDLAFHALREYVPGDDLRHVHWRSSAKAGALQIRQYHDTRRSHLTLVIDDDRGSYADPADFELAVSAAASMAARADQDGVDLSLLCGEHAVTDRGLDAVLDVCCRIEPTDSDPTAAARRALRLAPETSWLVVLTGGAAPDQLSSVLRAGLPPEVSLLLVTADGSAPTSVTALSAGARLLRLRALDELPPAVRAAAPQVLS